MVSRKAKGKLSLRDARPAEASALHELATRSLAWWGYDEARLAAWRAPPDIGETFVVEFAGELAGWAGLRPGARKGEFELPALYVDPALMRRGIGSLLLAEARRRAVRASAHRLVAIGDPNAEPFFREAGGKPMGRSPAAELPGGESARFEYPLGLTIRVAEREDADDISELVGSLATAFLREPDADEEAPLLRSFTPEAIARYVTGEQYRYYVADIGGRIVGVSALRDDDDVFHLFHLFVAPEWQGLGISTRLWSEVRDAVLDDGDIPADGAFTVNSALGAVPVYERFGFAPAGPRVEKNGIAFVPMRLAAKAAR
ncbi:MAG: GNAT family N-acetyltransferase [Burkholderiaceae bacterium]